MKRKLIKTAAFLAAAALAASNGMNVFAEQQPQSVYTVGSVSKMYVVTAALQLVEQGKLELDAPVTDYLPDFKMADPRYRDITVRMLMNHSSGLMGTSGIGSGLLGERSTHFHNTFLDYLKTQSLKADPGDFACYCNDGLTLLEFVVEQVSGTDYSDYLAEHICKPLGLTETGTLWTAFRKPNHVDVQLDSGVHFTPEYWAEIGSGGVLATAEEVSRFGTQFFTGNETLLSDRIKREMRKCYANDDFEDRYGLGWDFVGFADYDAQGVQLLSKGGDVANEHAELLVAPDHKISVSVLSNTGSSSMNLAMAEALMDIALEEQGITITHKDPACKKTLSTIPKSYQKYEGLYGGGSDVYRVTFPDMAYMQVQCLTNEIQSITHYLYTTEDTFVRMQGRVPSGNASEDPNQEVVSFRQRNGKDYICKDALNQIEQLGSLQMAEYGLQRLDETPVDAAAQKAWDERNGSRYYLYNELAASCYYLLPSQKLFVTDGYVSSCRITDETHAVHALQIPGNSGRDLTDLSIVQTDDGELLQMSSGTAYLAEKDFPVLTGAVRTVPLHTQQAGWYRIGDDMANKTITLDLPEKSAVYVYDRYDKPIYSSFMLDCADHIPLPSGGHIVFLGETGSSIEITS
ncbi:MAG TPA: hypothetical protein DCG49_09750 [Ruminococcus sp.]|nr:hypothetical protein [Ruminococcus sp.]